MPCVCRRTTLEFIQRENKTNNNILYLYNRSMRQREPNSGHECFRCGIMHSTSLCHAHIHGTKMLRSRLSVEEGRENENVRTIFTRVVCVRVTWPAVRAGRKRRRGRAVVQPRKKKRSVGPAGAAGRARRTDDNRSARSITHGDAGR